MGRSCWAGRAGLAGSSLLRGQLEVPPGGEAEAGEGRGPVGLERSTLPLPHFPASPAAQMLCTGCV